MKKYAIKTLLAALLTGTILVSCNRQGEQIINRASDTEQIRTAINNAIG